jgi:hypothetical protein
MYVNVGRILTPLRRLNVDPPPSWFFLLAWFCGGRWDAAEVSVFEAVAVSFQGDDVGVVDELSIMSAATVSSPKTSPQRLDGWMLLVTATERLS